jgi:hypothetical protein
VERLVKWTGGKKVVWNCIECTRINNPKKKATPDQVRSEVWMSIIHGAMGLIYFVHEWKPRFNESALLSDPEMLTAVKNINARIASLAAVLNSPTVEKGARVSSDGNPVAVMVKNHGGAIYLFACAMRDSGADATFTLSGLKGAREVEVLDEDRHINCAGGVFRDRFRAYDVHLYRINAVRGK